MYAIETKKRKFDRILDSLKDHPNASSTPPRPLVPRSQASTSSIVLAAQDSIAVAKRLRLSDPPAVARDASPSSPASIKTANYLPASRKAFLDRLGTFASITKWHVPSTDTISAAAWAKRGWKCTGTDLVSCGYCKEQLLVKIESDHLIAESTAHTTRTTRTTRAGLNDNGSGDNAAEVESHTDIEDPQSTGDELENESDVRSGLISKYTDLMATAHNEACPWRRRGCIDSIQRIEGLLSPSTVLASLHERYTGLVDPLDFAGIPQTHVTGMSPASETDLTHFTFDRNEIPPDHNAVLLAVCGWQKASGGGKDVVECRNCFRHLGLWLYRGEEPTMEKLEGVESHLEYCPWRSAEAQTTSAQVEGKMQLLPGWQLVLRAMRQPSSLRAETEDDRPAVESSTTSEEGIKAHTEFKGKERERKMKDLLRRIRDLKKPFNVKALLRDKT